ncbi:aldehyde dehydrogenase [Rhodococcus ruber BKS 20-38]|uniref:Aldehyde dehydrogenase n=1 Tax=Rhodococcus ruber BKS 20-38 TaxID=1278076 RepID=M2Y9C6_9NOCA|nr:aldehyde dehydrogenase family protein [Rhodococcus ruber]EME51527.1 aldehyde dehydrogenase [Rhodococcus ruber BKS 20-38]
MTTSTLPAYLTSHESAASDEFLQLIDGQLVSGARAADIVDPATGQVFATAPVADADQVNAAVAAAARAYPAWRDLTMDERGAYLSRIADAIEAHAEFIARLVTREQGKPIAQSREDVDSALMWTRYFASWRPQRKVVRDDDEAFVEIVRRPLGVVAAIIPWNFPFFQCLYKLAPALLTGNTVVLKPAPTTPLDAMFLGKLLEPILPAGVVNIVGDDGQTGPLLTSHPDVAKVSFTGSTTTGKAVMSSAAGTVKRVTLELGGNDAAIVLPDADVQAAAAGIFSGAFANSGQVCINIKRVFVHSSLYDQFCDEFARLADSTVVGPGLDEHVQVGPVQNARQFEALRRVLDRAREEGEIIAGGSVEDSAGYFVRPTVVRHIADDSPVVREETFGPIRPVLTYDDLDEVITRANGTEYGLGASVWGRDLERAASVAARLEAGSTWVNQHIALSPDVPFGGRKQSGIGSEFGEEGLATYTDVQVINVRRS